MTFIKRATKMMAATAITVALAACTAGEAPLETGADYVPEPEIDPATIAPCEDQFAFQRELNGAPDDTAVELSTSQGKSVTKEFYWYADTGIIVGFSYAEGETWCNVWTENGVGWNR